MHDEDRKHERRAKMRKLRELKDFIAFVLVILLFLGILMVQQENEKLRQQNEAISDMIPAVTYQVPSRGTAERIRSLGAFKIYHYCPCVKCCGKSDGITSTGARAREGRTIAVDPSVIPIGSEVIIDGETYIAEDTGASIRGNKIDVFVASHEKALQLGVRTAEVYLKK